MKRLVIIAGCLLIAVTGLLFWMRGEGTILHDLVPLREVLPNYENYPKLGEIPCSAVCKMDPRGYRGGDIYDSIRYCKIAALDVDLEAERPASFDKDELFVLCGYHDADSLIPIAVD